MRLLWFEWNARGNICYRSNQALPLSREILPELKRNGILQLDVNTALHASPIIGGHVVWQEDVY